MRNESTSWQRAIGAMDVTFGHGREAAYQVLRSNAEAKRIYDCAIVALVETQKTSYPDAVQPYAAAIRMVREAIEELFGPMADLESEEAVLLRGPEPHHDAEAIIAALQRVNERRIAPEAMASVLSAVGGKVEVPRHMMENPPREIIAYEDLGSNSIVYQVKR